MRQSSKEESWNKNCDRIDVFEKLHKSKQMHDLIKEVTGR